LNVSNLDDFIITLLSSPLISSITQSEIDSIKEAYKIIYRQNNTANEAIEKLAFSSDPHIIKLASFIKNSSRGIVR